MRDQICKVLFVLVANLGMYCGANVQAADLSGVWMQTAKGNQTWNPEKLPFTPAGLAAFKGNLPAGGEEQRLAAHTNDPIGGANPPGLYRSLTYPRPWQFIQLPDRVVQIFEWTNHWRTIWTDGRKVPEEVVTGPFWYGYAVGKWEGDTLVVQTVDLDGRAWMDGRGTPIAEYGAKVEERWKRTAPDTIELSITVTDPKYYTKPWTSTVRTYKTPAKGTEYAELGEVIFAPIDEQAFNSSIRDPSAVVPGKAP